MVLEGVDYAWSRPDPAGLYAAGKRFASRYLSYDTTGKNLTLAEAERLAAAGLAVVANWEWQAGDAKKGYGAGAQYAAEAVRQAAACGMPAGRPIYFSVDYDPAGAYGPVDDYFRGILSVLPLSEVGAYGGYDTIQHLFNAGLISWGWQTYAWSGGRWLKGAHVQQYQNGVNLAGGELDLDRAMVDDYGQWTPGGDDVTAAEVWTYVYQNPPDFANPYGFNMAQVTIGTNDAAFQCLNLLKEIRAMLDNGVEVPALVGLTPQALDDVETQVYNVINGTKLMANNPAAGG